MYGQVSADTSKERSIIESCKVKRVSIEEIYIPASSNNCIFKDVESDEVPSKGFCFQCNSPQFDTGPIRGEDSNPMVSDPDIIVSIVISSPF